MNIRASLPERSTLAAEGLPCRAFTVTDVERMVEVGLLPEDERVELIGGELVPMSPKGVRHETLKRALIDRWLRGLPGHLSILPETTLRLSADTYVEPDFVVFPADLPLAALSGGTVLLAIEIADTSLGYDLYRKPAICSAFGLRELWVIDAVRLVTHVHRDPRENGYATTNTVEAGDTLVPLLVPDLSLRLADLHLR